MEQHSPADRRRATATERIGLYLRDVARWYKQLLESIWSDAEHPGWLPPSPKRATRGYWDAE